MPTHSIDYLTTHEVARLLQVSPGAVLTWIDQGTLPAFRTPGGHRRVVKSTLARFVRDHGMPLPRELGVSRLLIVDDEPAFLRSAQRLLRSATPGLEIATATTAIDALLKVGTFRPDAVLLDAYMPGMDGVEVCKRLHSSPQTENIVIVAITGKPSAELEKDFKKAGASALLVKPLEAEELTEALGISHASMKER